MIFTGILGKTSAMSGSRLDTCLFFYTDWKHSCHLIGGYLNFWWKYSRLFPRKFMRGQNPSKSPTRYQGAADSRLQFCDLPFLLIATWAIVWTNHWTDIVFATRNGKFWLQVYGWWWCQEYFQSVYKANICCSFIWEVVKYQWLEAMVLPFSLELRSRKIVGPWSPVTLGRYI